MMRQWIHKVLRRLGLRKSTGKMEIDVSQVDWSSAGTLPEWIPTKEFKTTINGADLKALGDKSFQTTITFTGWQDIEDDETEDSEA